MNEQRLRELLKDADAGAMVDAGSASGFADRVIRRARRRSRVRRVGYGLVAVHGVLALAFVMFESGPGYEADSELSVVDSGLVAVETVEDPSAFEDLRARIAMQESVVRTLLTRSETHAPGFGPLPDPLAAVEGQVDLAAKRMVLTADRIERETGPSEMTRGLYAGVVANFPDSAWAGVARRRMDTEQTFTEPRSAL